MKGSQHNWFASHKLYRELPVAREAFKIMLCLSTPPPQKKIYICIYEVPSNGGEGRAAQRCVRSHPCSGRAELQRGETHVPCRHAAPRTPGWAAPAAYVPGIAAAPQLKHVRFNTFLTASDMKTSG